MDREQLRGGRQTPGRQGELHLVPLCLQSASDGQQAVEVPVARTDLPAEQDLQRPGPVSFTSMAENPSYRMASGIETTIDAAAG